MLNIISLSLFIGVVTAQSQWNPNRCWTDGNGETRARWWEPGSIITRGSLYYECVSGRLQTRGCMSPNNRRLPLGATVTRGRYELRCARDQQNRLYLEQSACLPKRGGRYASGQNWRDGQIWYECSSQPLYGRQFLRVVTSGCDQNGRQVKLKQRVVNDEDLLECRRSYKGAKLALVGCVHEGRRYELRQTFNDGQFVYECTNRAGHATIKTTKCLNEGNQLNSGDRYFKEDSVYQCQILWNRAKRELTKQVELVGCVEKNQLGTVIRERVLGCQWYIEGPQCNYEYICNQEGKTETVGCTLTKNGVGYLFVPADSYTIHYFKDRGNRGVGCRLRSDQTLEYFEFDPDDVQRRAYDLKYAIPRGK